MTGGVRGERRGARGSRAGSLGQEGGGANALAPAPAPGLEGSSPNCPLSTTAAEPNAVNASIPSLSVEATDYDAFKRGDGLWSIGNGCIHDPVGI